MTNQDVLDCYIEYYVKALHKNKRVLSMLKNSGILERFIFDNFKLGYSDGKILDFVDENEELKHRFKQIGLLQVKFGQYQSPAQRIMLN